MGAPGGVGDAIASVLRRALGSSAGGARWRRLGWVSAAALAAVLLAGTALLAGRVAASWARSGGGHAQLIVYLKEGVSEAERGELAEELAGLGGVSGVQAVAPDEALRRLRTALAADQALLDGVEPEAMPASIEATLEPGVEAVLPMSPTTAALRRHPAVDDLVIEPAPPDTLGRAMIAVAPLTRSLTYLFAGLAALLLFGIARLAHALPRQELAVARLLGAGPGFHLVPRAIAAAVAASLGAVVGVAALLLGGLQLVAALTAALAGSSTLAALPTGGSLLGAGDAALLVATAAVVAAAGAARAALSEPADA